MHSNIKTQLAFLCFDTERFDGIFREIFIIDIGAQSFQKIQNNSEFLNQILNYIEPKKIFIEVFFLTFMNDFPLSQTERFFE